MMPILSEEYTDSMERLRALGCWLAVMALGEIQIDPDSQTRLLKLLSRIDFSKYGDDGMIRLLFGLIQQKI